MTDALARLRKITSTGTWRGIVESVLSNESELPSSQEDFGTYWIEGGHRIREQVSDDRMLSRFLRASLSAYANGPVTLFRGENQDRFSAGSVGFAWTSDSSVATMFARGLNAIGSGGVLISATLDAPAIISGPNAHSLYLGEHQYTVDPFAISGVHLLSTFSGTAA